MGRFSSGRIALWMAGCCCLAAPLSRAQVFTVGKTTATADIVTDFTPTRVELPSGHLSERGRRDLLRNLEAEEGFAHRVLPVGTTLTLQANGKLTPGADDYKTAIYKKGQAAAAGDRVVITGVDVKADRILVDINGGPYPPHRFLRHIQVGVGGAFSPEPDLSEQGTGCRITLVFEGGVPDLAAPEVKALLEPVIDFRAKRGEEAYADTLPAPVKSAIASHEVLVGMSRRMVIASLGQPEQKMRETVEGERYEEWIYGHQPQTVKFVRFLGDRVSQIKFAAVGKPIEIHDQDELGGYLPPAPTRVIAMGDVKDPEKTAPPTLLKAGEKAEGGGGTDSAQGEDAGGHTRTAPCGCSGGKFRAGCHAGYAANAAEHASTQSAAAGAAWARTSGSGRWCKLTLAPQLAETGPELMADGRGRRSLSRLHTRMRANLSTTESEQWPR